MNMQEIADQTIKLKEASDHVWQKGFEVALTQQRFHDLLLAAFNMATYIKDQGELNERTNQSLSDQSRKSRVPSLRSGGNDSNRPDR
jgi:hypothetical protein